MQRRTGTMAALLGLSLAMTTLGVSGAFAQGPPPPPPGYQEGPPQPWEAPPREFQDIQRRGFHDGIEGARKDFQNHRPPNVNNRDEFRHPDVSRDLWHDYRQGFRRGYQVGVQHIYGGGGGPRPY